MNRRVKQRSLGVGAFLLLIAAAMLGYAGAGLGASVRTVNAPADQGVVAGEITVEVEGTAVPSLRRLEVKVVASNPGHPVRSDANASKEYGLGEKVSDVIGATWDTSQITLFNGLYAIKASATSQLGETTEQVVANILVDNPPTTPSGLHATVFAGKPELTWDKNPELDLIGYSVSRSAGNLEPQEVGTAVENRFLDESAAQGVKLTYYVRALRKSVASPDGRISSEVVSALPIEIPATKVLASVSIPPPATARVEPIASTVEIEAVVHDQFSSTLPYPAPADVEDLESIDVSAAMAPQQTSVAIATNQVSKPPYVATALLMIAAAGHLIRLAGRLRTIPAGKTSRGRAGAESRK